jgi:hypothetical protein
MKEFHPHRKRLKNQRDSLLLSFSPRPSFAFAARLADLLQLSS